MQPGLGRRTSRPPVCDVIVIRDSAQRVEDAVVAGIPFADETNRGLRQHLTRARRVIFTRS